MASNAFCKVLRGFWLFCIPGGALWSLSPLGIRLSEYKYKTPDVFWKLFPAAPLLLLVGLTGVYLLYAGRPGWLTRIGLFAALAGLVMVLAGDLGLFYLQLDSEYIMTAPAYHAFRGGLVLLAAGSMLFGVGAAREEALPVWGALPLVPGSLLGLVAVSRDLGSLGAALWIAFGLSWVWLGAVLAWRTFRPAVWGR